MVCFFSIFGADLKLHGTFSLRGVRGVAFFAQGNVELEVVVMFVCVCASTGGLRFQGLVVD